MPTYEMFWDCKYCDTAKLLGKTHRHCPECGAPQDPDSRYFPPEDEKVAVEDHQFVGADLRCPSCDTPNSAAAHYCTNCGNVLEEGSAVSTKGEVDAGAQSGTRKPAKPAPPPEPEPESSGRAGAAAGMGLLGMGCTALIVGVFALFLVVCLLNVFWTSDADLTVKGHSWTRSIEIEKLQTSKEDDWCDKMPASATNVQRSEKERKTRKVKDGETCKTKNVDNGDGTFKTKQECTPKYRDEPVMEPWCRWDEEKWKTHDTKRTSGEGLDSTPEWPTVKVDGCKTLGCTREGSRTERYEVALVEADGTAQTCSVPASKWKSMAVGSSWTGSKKMLTGSLTCSDLAPAK
ncbi:MAG: zinc ribbon domain-containing protein [Myxococcota bacterium]